MRRLAQELDVWPMAVYRYFRDKDELVDALVGSAIEGIELPSGRGSWRTQLRELLGAARRTLERLPPELRVRLAPALLGPGPAGLSETGLAVLANGGFRQEQAGRAWTALAAYTAGAVEIAPTMADAQFDYGLDRLMDGFERKLPPPSRATRSTSRA